MVRSAQPEIFTSSDHAAVQHTSANILDGSIQNVDFANDFLSDTKGDVDLKSSRLLSENMLVKEQTDEILAVRNRDDTTFRSLILESLYFDELFGRTGADRVIQHIDENSTRAVEFRSYDTEWQIVAKLLNGKFELHRGILQGDLGINGKRLTGTFGGPLDISAIPAHSVRERVVPADYSTTSTAWVDIPGAGGTITLGADSIVVAFFIAEARLAEPGSHIHVRIMRDTSQLDRRKGDFSDSGGITLIALDKPGDGTFTYKVQTKVDSGTGELKHMNCLLLHLKR